MRPTGARGATSACHPSEAEPPTRCGRGLHGIPSPVARRRHPEGPTHRSREGTLPLEPSPQTMASSSASPPFPPVDGGWRLATARCRRFVRIAQCFARRWCGMTAALGRPDRAHSRSAAAQRARRVDAAWHAHGCVRGAHRAVRRDRVQVGTVVGGVKRRQRGRAGGRKRPRSARTEKGGTLPALARHERQPLAVSTERSRR